MANNFSNTAKPLYIRSVLNDSDSSSVIQVSSTPGGGQEDGSAFGWPSAPFFVIIDPNAANQEVVKVTAKSGSGSTTQYTVTRGSSLGPESYGSTTKSHNAWSIISPLWSAADASNALAAADILTGGKTITNQTASSSALVIKEASAQSASVLQMLTSAGTEYLKIAPGGNITLTKAAPVFKISAASGYATMYINGGNQQDEAVIFQTNNQDRWKVMSDSVIESGGDTGSNFAIYRVTDAGNSGLAFTINRETGVVHVPNTIDANWIWSTTGFGTATTPTQTYHLTNKEYVDYVVTSKLPLSGGTLTGNLVLQAPGASLWLDGTGAGDAASVAFVQNSAVRWTLGCTEDGTIAFYRHNAAGSYVDAPLVLAADGKVTVPTPTAGGHAATKAYSDTKLPLAGGTLTGNLAIGKADASLWLDATGTGDAANIFFQNNGTIRWQLAMDDFGGFGFHRFNGTYQGTPLYLGNDGTITVETPTNANNPATKAYVDDIKTSVKSIAAASSDFNDFKARMAAW